MSYTYIVDPFGTPPPLGGGAVTRGSYAAQAQKSPCLSKHEIRKQAGELYRQLVLKGFCTDGTDELLESAEKAADAYYNYLTKENT